MLIASRVQHSRYKQPYVLNICYYLLYVLELVEFSRLQSHEIFSNTDLVDRVDANRQLDLHMSSLLDISMDVCRFWVKFH